jgi:hypothetical protein
MAVQKVPQNQLSALPLQTADTASNPGDVYIIGNTMVRYWSKTNTGINARALADDPMGTGVYTYMVTNWLDVRGCSAFQGVLTRAVDAVGNDSVTNIIMYAQYQSASGAQPPTGLTGVTLGGALATITPVAKPAALAYPWTYVTARSLQFAAVNPVLNVGVMGFNVRLWFSRVTASIYAGELYSLELWGTSQ